jgi:K+-sensing histidine kinase KdpD
VRTQRLDQVRRTSRRPGAYSVAAGAAALFIVSALAPDLGLPTAYTVTLAALITAAASVGISLPAALSVAGIGWLYLTGFVFNDHGELHIHSPGDWLRLALMLGDAVLISRATRGPPSQAPRRSPSGGSISSPTSSAGGWPKPARSSS